MRFQTGIAYYTIGAVFNQGSTFAVNIVVAHLLGRQIFGEYAMVQSTLLALGVIAQMAAAYTVLKYVAEFRSTDRDRAGRILTLLSAFSAILAGIATLALLFLAPWLAGYVLKAPGLGPVLATGSAVLLFTTLNGSLMGTLAGLECFRRLATVLVWSGLVYLFVCTGSAWLGGLNGAVAGQAFAGLFQFVFLAVAMRKECSLRGIKIHVTGSTQEWRVIVKFMLPGAMAGITSMPALWLANTFLVRQPDGYSQMAIYSASSNLMMAILFLPNIANYVGMSLINHYKGAGQEAEYRRTFWTNLSLSTTIVILGTFVLAVFGADLLRIFGIDFKDGYPVLFILLPATIAQGFGLAMYQIIQSHAKMWLSLLAIALPRDMLMVGFAFLLIPTHGAKGLASAYAISWTLASLIIASIVYRIGLKPSC